MELEVLDPVSSSACEDGRGNDAHIPFPSFSEDDEEEPHSSTCEDDRGGEVHISFPISEDDAEEDHVPYSTSEDDGEESHLSFPEDDGEESHLSFPEDDEKVISKKQKKKKMKRPISLPLPRRRIWIGYLQFLKMMERLFPKKKDDEMKANISSSPEKKDLDLVSSIKQKSLVMPKWIKVSSASKSCSIHRVPFGLRKHNPKAYDPQLISIGPFHYEKRKAELRAMEEHKWRYLHDVVSEKSKSWWETCVATIRRSEKIARSCYSEVITLDSDSFVVMMLLDSCFIIEFLRLRRDRKCQDVIFELGWPEEALSCDLLLMENQIPFFIVRLVYDLIYDSTQSPLVESAPEASTQSPLVESALEFIFAGKSGNMVDKISGYHFHHLLHLLHACYILINNSNIKKDRREQPSKRKRIPCASKLVEAGIRFRKREDSKKKGNVVDCLKFVGAGIRFRKRDDSKKKEEEDVIDFLDIKFDKGKGVIEIPSILVWGVTKVKFLNLIAFEQCYRPCPKRITSYTFFMDCLINTAKDVEILSKKGIICALGDEELVASDFNCLAKEPSIYYTDFYLSEVCEDIISYSSRNWPKLRASLVHDYFKNPWALISVFAALLLFLLAMIQTFFTSFPKFAYEN